MSFQKVEKFITLLPSAHSSTTYDGGFTLIFQRKMSSREVANKGFIEFSVVLLCIQNP